ncbi:MAG: hypothetical protein AVDCRST_MAG89-2371, partial [uncultured Gemmatimonadetes bacterium]
GSSIRRGRARPLAGGLRPRGDLHRSAARPGRARSRAGRRPGHPLHHPRIGAAGAVRLGAGRGRRALPRPRHGAVRGAWPLPAGPVRPAGRNLSRGGDGGRADARSAAAPGALPPALARAAVGRRGRGESPGRRAADGRLRFGRNHHAPLRAGRRRSGVPPARRAPADRSPQHARRRRRIDRPGTFPGGQPPERALPRLGRVPLAEPDRGVADRCHWLSRSDLESAGHL